MCKYTNHVWNIMRSSHLVEMSFIQLYNHPFNFKTWFWFLFIILQNHWFQKTSHYLLSCVLIVQCPVVQENWTWTVTLSTTNIFLLKWVLQGVPFKNLMHAQLAGLSIFFYCKKSLFPYVCVQTLINVFYMITTKLFTCFLDKEYF